MGLCRHISQVHPSDGPGVGEQQTYVTAVGSEVACKILSDRFASSDNTGVSELVEWCLWFQEERWSLRSETESPSARAGSGPVNARLAMQGFMGAALMQDPACIAGLLVSIPDRLPARERQASLEPSAFLNTILVLAIVATQKLYDLLFPGEEPAGHSRDTPNEGEKLRSSERTSPESFTTDGSCLASAKRHVRESILRSPNLLSDDERAKARMQFVHAVAFLEALFQKCCLRGHAGVAARAIARTCCTNSITRLVVLHCCDKVGTPEIFIQQLLVLVSLQREHKSSSQIPSVSGLDVTNEPNTVRNGKGHDKEDTDLCSSRPFESRPAVQMMTAVFGQASSMPASVRYVLCERMLTSCTLPSSALVLLLDFIALSNPQEEGASASNEDSACLEAFVPEEGARMNDPANLRSLLGQVSYNIASVWGNAHTVHHLALPQQAYISCALENCLARLCQGYLNTVEGGV